MQRTPCRLRSIRALAFGVACVALSVAAEESVSLVPARAPAWRASRVWASLKSQAREPRELRVESEPSGAQLELAYLRDGAEVARARGATPLIATLPSVALTGANDRIVVRAELAGFTSRELAQGVLGAPRRVLIELAPQPRKLLGLSLLELAGHSRFELVSDLPLEARLTSTAGGWRLALADVALDSPHATRLASLHGEATVRIDAIPVGGDVLLELTRGPNERREPRLVRRDEAVRSASHLALEWLPEDRGDAGLARATRALAALGREPPGVCGDAFERALAESLGQETLARSLAPGGAFTDAYVALAIESIADVSSGRELALRDGSRVRLDGGVARARVLAQAAEAGGLLVAIRTIANALAPPRHAQRALHAWLAPERDPAAFSKAYAHALAIEASCLERP